MAGLTWASWTILTTHGLWFSALAVEINSFWAMRRKLKIHARSPMLAVVSGFGGSYMQLVIMFFELFAQEGITIPCTFMLYSNVVFMTFYPLPYLLRGLRVVIVSDKVWRAKYSTVLSRRNVFLMLFMAFVAFTLIATLLKFIAPNRYGANPTKVCFAIADWWLYGPICMVCAGISSKLFIELARVQDRINMSKEISSAAIAWLVTSVPFYLMFILNDFNVVVAPRPVNFLVSTCVFLTGLSTFFIEPRRSKGVIHIFPHRKKKIAVVMDEPQILAWKDKWHDSRVIMAYPPLDHAFEKHVQDYLCSESYDFLKALDRYIEKSANMEPEKQFDSFRDIVNMYIMPGSELEVNIETSMRNKILKIGDHDNFIAAEVTMKRDIFNPSGTEIRKMLDENLLKTFLVSSSFLNVCKQLQEEADIESSISTMVDANLPESTPLELLDDKMREEDVEESEMVLSLAKASLHFN